ncbi:stage III sporulation protein AF [Candidatus Merdisoma sp. JLR.KK006]|jgi:hypothetical protein|uniref:stage III sporulation protein AF n=1 Tax=Candidatus Merdisoma sp. JLR.KK006 TaxID=3112626 RepID=UPI002FF0689B
MVVVLHVLPEKNQRKYLQFFMGIVLMILVMSPLLSALGLDRQLDKTYARQTYDRELQEFLERQEAVEEEYQRYMEEKLYEARDEAESLKEEQREQEGQEERLVPQGGDESGIPEIHIEIGKPEED